jgi:hypothetical protein
MLPAQERILYIQNQTFTGSVIISNNTFTNIVANTTGSILLLVIVLLAQPLLYVPPITTALSVPITKSRWRYDYILYFFWCFPHYGIRNQFRQQFFQYDLPWRHPPLQDGDVLMERELRMSEDSEPIIHSTTLRVELVLSIFCNAVLELPVPSQGMSLRILQLVQELLALHLLQVTILFRKNTITGMSSTLGAVVGLSITGAAGSTQSVTRNKIGNLQSMNATGTVNGILVSGGITVNLVNNLIGDLRAPITSSTVDAIRGINLTSTTALSNINVYFNTIYINAQSTGANFHTSGLFHTFNTTATTATLDMRNNVIVNNSNANGTGLTVAFRRSAATNLNNYATTSIIIFFGQEV